MAGCLVDTTNVEVIPLQRKGNIYVLKTWMRDAEAPFPSKDHSGDEVPTSRSYIDGNGEHKHEPFWEDSTGNDGKGNGEDDEEHFSVFG